MFCTVTVSQLGWISLGQEPDNVGAGCTVSWMRAVCALVIEKSFVVFGKGVKGKPANKTVIEKEFCEGDWV